MTQSLSISLSKAYQPGKIGQLVHLIAEKWKIDEKEIRANLVLNFPELKDKAHCANCGESMAVYNYSVTILDTRLLCAMANVITDRMNKGKSFTDANKIHLSSEIKNYTLISRQTISSKLGLIAKVMKKDDAGENVHDRKAGWSITKRGYNFLRGEPIPRMVKVFHNKIQEHYEDTITINDIINITGNMDESKILADIAGVFVEIYQKPKML